MDPNKFVDGEDYELPGHETPVTFKNISWSANGTTWEAVFKNEEELEIRVTRTQLIESEFAF